MNSPELKKLIKINEFKQQINELNTRNNKVLLIGFSNCKFRDMAS